MTLPEAARGSIAHAFMDRDGAQAGYRLKKPRDEKKGPAVREETVDRTREYMERELMKLAGYPNCTERDARYRIEHSYRVAHIAREIAQREGLDQERAYVSGLLHDIGYSVDFRDGTDYREHGRIGAAIARPFLPEMGYGEAETNEMCYGIAIHVDDRADFEGERTPLALTIGDADNIDRFDALRLYEGLAGARYGEMTIAEQEKHVDHALERLSRLKALPFGTATATGMWREKLDFQTGFYERLKRQITMSR